MIDPKLDRAIDTVRSLVAEHTRAHDERRWAAAYKEIALRNKYGDEAWRAIYGAGESGWPSPTGYVGDEFIEQAARRLLKGESAA